MTATAVAGATSLPSPSPTQLHLLCGDVNGNGIVDAVDAELILQFDARIIAALPHKTNADVNVDHHIDSLDAALILQGKTGLGVLICH